MDLALTRRGDYAVRAALCLAKRGGDGHYVKIREVAQTMALPASYTDGGYRSARQPHEVALLEVVEAAEGPFTLERCILRGHGGGTGPWQRRRVRPGRDGPSRRPASAASPAWSAPPAASAGSSPPIVVGLIYQVTGDYAIGLMLLSDVALAGLVFTAWRLGSGAEARAASRAR